MDPYRQQNPYGIPPPSNNGYGAPPPTYQPGYAPPPPGYPGYSGQPGYGGAVPPPPPMGIAGVAPGYGAAPSAYGQPQGPKPAAPRPNNMSGYNTAPGYDAEAAQAASYASAFIEKKVRSAFVRKVFILVFLQLCVTIGIAAVFLFVNPVNEYVAGPKYTYTKSDGTEGTYRGPAPGAWVFYASWGLTLVMLIVLMCFTSVRRKYPCECHACDCALCFFSRGL